MYTPVYTLSRVVFNGHMDEEEIITSVDRDKIANAAVRELEINGRVELKLTIRNLD